MAITQMMNENKEVVKPPSLVHFVWDEDPDESLCGVDMTNCVWVDGEASVDCPKCVEIDEMCNQADTLLNVGL